MQTNIENIISKFKQSCSNSVTEEDIRIQTNILLDNLTTFYSLKKKVISEVSSVQGGRADSIYSDIIFEFKKPKKFNTQKGIDEAIYGTVYSRYDYNTETLEKLTDLRIAYIDEKDLVAMSEKELEELSRTMIGGNATGVYYVPELSEEYIRKLDTFVLTYKLDNSTGEYYFNNISKR